MEIKSSNIKSVDWKDRVLTVEFRQGGKYEYYEVPESVYEGMINAQSAGKFFHAMIKDIYNYKKV